MLMKEKEIFTLGQMKKEITSIETILELIEIYGVIV
jgi:hypothetical protein